MNVGIQIVFDLGILLVVVLNFGVGMYYYGRLVERVNTNVDRTDQHSRRLDEDDMQIQRLRQRLDRAGIDGRQQKPDESP